MKLPEGISKVSKRTLEVSQYAQLQEFGPITIEGEMLDVLFIYRRWGPPKKVHPFLSIFLGPILWSQ